MRVAKLAHEEDEESIHKAHFTKDKANERDLVLQL